MTRVSIVDQAPVDELPPACIWFEDINLTLGARVCVRIYVRVQKVGGGLEGGLWIWERI